MEYLFVTNASHKLSDSSRECVNQIIISTAKCEDDLYELRSNNKAILEG